MAPRRDWMSRTTKRCRDCGKVKPLAGFTTYRTDLGQRWRPYCKPCASERSKRYYARSRHGPVSFF